MDRSQSSPRSGCWPETPAVLAVRRAIRQWQERYSQGAPVAVALSGGADSLALTAGAVAEIGTVDALIVDHGLQPGSDQVAAAAAMAATALGCRSARVLPVAVGAAGGMEAAARRARYAALEAVRGELPVLLGHTLDDQAETVLLGLARGSGARSLQAMAPNIPPWGRPLLEVRRTVTRQVCADLALVPHEDPHNTSAEFTRVRLRHEVLPLLEEVLGSGVAEALARTAQQARDDNTALDEFAQTLLHTATIVAIPPGGADRLSCAVLATAPGAVRRRAIRLWLLAGGAKAVTAKHLYGVENLVVAWRGQGGVAVGGGAVGTRLVASREHGRLTLTQVARE